MTRDLNTKCMETIIGLLFILLPIIFRLIGKKLEQSGHGAPAEKMRKIADAFGEDEDAVDDGVETDDDGQIVFVPPVQQPVQQPVWKPEPLPVTAHPKQKPKPVVKAKPAVARKPILLEEEPEKKNHEKIDPKKLVIYSEIMKPKF